MTRAELLAETVLPNNGATTRVIEELELSGFLLQLPQFHYQKKGAKYHLIDVFSFFFLAWVDDIKSQILAGTDPDQWMKLCQPSSRARTGYAFEAVCLKHIKEIRETPKIGGVACGISHWTLLSGEIKNERGVEIDLVIDRADECINLCEI